MTTLQLFRVALLSGAAAFMIGCGGSSTPPPPTAAAPPAPEKVLPPGTPVERTLSFVSPTTKKTYSIETVKDDREEELRKLPAGARDVAPSAGDVTGEDYRGTARKAAKLSIADATAETFSDVSEFIATLPAHNAMVNHIPKITTTAGSNRVKEEKRNVKLTAFLYAASREDDNDFHLIVGRAPGAAPPVYFTVELSGLPPSNSPAFPKLNAARNAFKGFFGSSLPGSSYDFYNPPIPVEVEGSLFFDMSHATGSRPGPATLRPKMPVVWEVHPITKIVFEP